MRILTVSLLALVAGCATLSDIDLKLSADELADDAVVLKLPDDWRDVRSARSPDGLTIEASQYGWFFATGAHMTVTLRNGKLPTGFDEAQAARLVPEGAMLGPIDAGDARIRFRWALRTPTGFRYGTVALATPVGHPDQLMTFKADWPSDVDSGTVIQELQEITDVITHGFRRGL